MNIADIVVCCILIAILVAIFYTTRDKKGKHKSCGSCDSDCSSCHAFASFYDDYKKDQTKESDTEE